MIKKISLLGCVLISFGYSNITETQTWNTKDVQKEFLDHSFCDKSLSKEDCDKLTKEYFPPLTSKQSLPAS